MSHVIITETLTITGTSNTVDMVMHGWQGYIETNIQKVETSYRQFAI